MNPDFITPITVLISAVSIVSTIFYLNAQMRIEYIKSDKRWATLKRESDERWAKLKTESDDRWANLKSGSDER